MYGSITSLGTILQILQLIEKQIVSNETNEWLLVNILYLYNLEESVQCNDVTVFTSQLYKLKTAFIVEYCCG